MFYQSLGSSLQVSGLPFAPPPQFSFCQFSAVSSTDIFISVPLHCYHHFIISQTLHISGPGALLFIYLFSVKAVSPDRAGGTERRPRCTFPCVTLIIGAGSFQRVRRLICMCVRLRLHVTTHEFKEEEDKEKGGKKREG